MSLSKFLTFFSPPYFRLSTWALFMVQITLLFLQKPGKNFCLQFRRLWWTWSFLVLQREDILLRLVLLLTHFLSLSLSQTYISCFSSLGFQITILNSPTQFLSLTLSFPLAISLSFVSRSSVFMNVCNLWPCMYVDVNVYCYSCGYVAMYVCRWERV